MGVIPLFLPPLHPGRLSHGAWGVFWVNTAPGVLYWTPGVFFASTLPQALLSA